MKLTRRRFILGAGAVTAASALAPGIRIAETFAGQQGDATATRSTGTRRQWAMVIDLRKCEGCVTQDAAPACTEGCNAEHFVPAGQEWIKVFRMESESANGSYFLPRPCMHCENAPCLNVCPVGATYRDDEGLILINHERCIGCRFCMAACPYGARSFNWDQPENPAGATFAEYSPQFPVPHRKGTVEKCMLCAHRTKDGKLPACAENCPMNAIYLGDLVEDIATNGKDVVKLSEFLSQSNAFRLKEELGTRPRVWYIPGHGEEYGRTALDAREPREARTWEEQGTTYEAPKEASNVVE